MNEFRVELFVARDDEQDIMLSSLNEDEIEKWKEDMEVRALSEYYKQKIKITDQKIWFQKAALLKLMHRINSCRFFGEGG